MGADAEPVANERAGSPERAPAASLEAPGHRRDIDLWGWKDPRTSLLLTFWDSLLDEARYLFVYRHPVDVLSSLVRRRSFACFAWRLRSASCAR